MKLCIVNNADLPPKWSDRLLARYKTSFAKVLRPETEVVLKPAKGGLRGDNVLDYDNPYFDLLNKRSIIEALLEAEREGFDAAWVNCFADPGIREARAVVRMPVLGPAESTLHFACQLGRKLAIITANMPGQIAQVEEQVRGHGLENRLIADGIRMDKEPFPQAYQKALRDPKAATAGIAEIAEECVADGADVIVVGCCALGPICSAAGFNKLLINGQAVPIIDPVMVVAKMAEAAVDIHSATGLPIWSRTRNYVLPSEDDWKRVRSVFGLTI